jgi:hypothetical protein
MRLTDIHKVQECHHDQLLSHLSFDSLHDVEANVIEAPADNSGRPFEIT